MIDKCRKENGSDCQHYINLAVFFLNNIHEQRQSHSNKVVTLTLAIQITSVTITGSIIMCCSAKLFPI